MYYVPDVVHVYLHVLHSLPFNWIFAELQSSLVVIPDDDQLMKLNAQLSEKMLYPHSLNGYVNYHFVLYLD
jgi:hypothetical protein